MQGLNVSTVDVVIVVIVLLSTIFATWRGFVRETLSILAWAAAAFATVYFGPALAQFLKPHFSTPFLSTILAYAGLFLAVLLPLSILGHHLSRRISRSPIGAIDRILGFGFGVIRGLAIVGAAYLVFSLVIPERDDPVWLTEASLLPVVKEAGNVLLSLMPARYSDAFAKKTSGPISQSGEPARVVALPTHKTYGAEDRRALDRPIEATGRRVSETP